ncbi:MAG: carbohydrate kinase, partial [Caldilineae bacterium]
MQLPQPVLVDLLCVGVACYDLTFSVERHVGPNEKIRASDLVGCGGGLAANAAVTAAKLGYTVAFVGYLGQDLYGDEHLREFREAGVLTDFVVRGAWPTSLSAILVQPDGKRALVNYGGGRAIPLADQVDLTRLRPRSILLDGHHLDVARPLVERARREGIPTVLDADSVHPGTEALMDRVEFLVASERFAQVFTGEEDPEAWVERLSAHAPSVVVTLGEEGLIWRNRADSRFGPSQGRFPAFPVPVVDTTGAGDAFHGAFAARLSRPVAW